MYIAFLLLFLLYWGSNFLYSTICLLSKEFHLACLSKHVFLGGQKLRYPSSKDVFNSLSLLMNIFCLNLKFWVDGSFPLALSKCCPAPSRFPGFWLKQNKTNLSFRLFSYKQCTIFSQVFFFWDFLLYLENLATWLCCVWVFIDLALSCMGFPEPLEFVGLHLLPDLGSFQLLMFQIFFFT